MFVPKMVAVDMDGTFLRGDHDFSRERFARVLGRMHEQGCRFVVASGNQFWQLRDLFPDCDEELAFVAENGAYIKDRDEVVFVGEMSHDVVVATLDWIESQPDVENIMSCLNCAYIARGRASEQLFRFMQTYYHRLQWADDLRQVSDRVLKFAINVPEAQTWEYFDRIRESLAGGLEPTTSGHGAIDLILPGCHKASGLKRLVERWDIDPAECVAFGDGGNDIEMLRYVGHSYAMANAASDVKEAADNVCPSNEAEGVLTTLEDLFA